MTPSRSLPLRVFLAVTWLLTACAPHDDESSARDLQADTRAPRFASALTMEPNPSGNAPLTALIEFETDEPAYAVLTIDDRDAGEVRTITPSTELSTTHRVPVLGVLPASTVQLEVVAVDAAGNASDVVRRTWLTPELPLVFPPITLQPIAQPGPIEPGVTLFDADSPGPSGPATTGMIVAIDERGRVVWYYVGEPGIGDIRQLPNGNLMYMYGRYGLVEIDMLGNVVHHWWASRLNGANAPAASTPVDADSFHHDVLPLDREDTADFIVLSSELRTLPNYPQSYTNPAQLCPTKDVVGDVLLWLDRDGKVVRELSLFDVLDPYRISWDSFNRFWDPVYQRSTADWSHANAIVRDPADGNLVVSLRHQDATIKIDIETGALLWILGDPGGWQPPWSDVLLTGVPSVPGGTFEWPYHAHAPDFTPWGTFLLFDNGVGRAIPPVAQMPEEERYSRVVELDVDEGAGDVRLSWSYGRPGGWYSFFLGDADLMPVTGNVLICDGGKSEPYGETGSRGFARLVEVTRTTPHEVVWEVTIKDTTNNPPVNWNVYRAERLASLYPHARRAPKVPLGEPVN